MNTYPLVSILIANYNNARHLNIAIESIYAQTYSNWEIIIIDDCSTDNPQLVYNKYKEDSKIKIYFNDQNKGCGYTKRRCVNEATGEICAFVDPDDAIVENAIEKMVEAHIEQKDVSLIYSKFYYCDEDLNIKKEHSTSHLSNTYDPYFFNFNGQISHFVSFKKEYYDKTPGINPHMKRAVDQDLYLKLYEVGKTFFIDQPLYYYRIHSGGISTTTNARKAYYWHWMAIFDAIERRNINFEDKFYDYFIPKHEYDYISKKYSRYKKIDRIVEKIKRLFNR